MTRKCIAVLSFLFVLSFIVFSDCAFARSSSEVSVSDAGINSAAGDKKADAVIKKYFESVFEKNYENAAGLMGNKVLADREISRMERWRESFLSPSDLKIINKKTSQDGVLIATVTFNYMNSNGVKDIKREKITLKLQNGDYEVASVPSFSKNNPSQTDSTVQNAAATPNNQAPVTIPSFPSMSGASASPDLSSMINMLGGASTGAGSANIDPGELMGLMTELVNDPEVIALSANPKIMAIAKDPSMMSTLLSGNMSAIESNPKVKELLNDPSIRKIVEKIAAKKSGASISSPAANGSAEPPSSINGVDVDKIFE